MSYCDRCDRYFRSEDALQQHLDKSSAHWICNDCDLDFTSWLGLKEHYVQSRRHAYCQYCDEHFDCTDELEEHYENVHYYCSDCKRVFKDEHGLNEHLRQSPNHNYCPECRRDFSSPNALRNHLNSSIHRSKDIACPFNCAMEFVSVSALILHFESGKCESGIDRAAVNKVVRFYDRHGYITDPSRMLTSGNDDDTRITYHATGATWNGYSYECYLCHSTYRTLPALNQHLASPRHQEKIYFCPKDDCRVPFKTLSALFQHVESEKCGVIRFQKVQNLLDNVPKRVLAIHA